MYTTYIMKRTQIYIDEEQDARLALRAHAAGTTKSDLIRAAVAAYLAEPPDDAARLMAFRAAVRATAGAASRLPPGSRYVDELRQADAERERDLETRRR